MRCKDEGCACVCHTKREQRPVKEWLTEMLSWGSESVEEIMALAAHEGYSQRAVYYAAKSVGVVRTDHSSGAGGPGKPPRREVRWALP